MTIEEYQAFLSGSTTVTWRLGHSSNILNTVDPDWWARAFTGLLYRGDFVVQPGMALWRWLKLLLQRVDFLVWAMSKPFAAAGYNICLRREQIREVASYVRNCKEFRQFSPDLMDMAPRDMVAAALAEGVASSIWNALKKKNINVRVKNVLRSMEIAIRKLEGSEGERDVLR